mmetsp:Transcript_90042/g.234707  ORF Transcript_90042/g.234707 Transcript_90042/m.234707 type:complete len:201 (-) Transcript_90042:5-607(-)
MDNNEQSCRTIVHRKKFGVVATRCFYRLEVLEATAVPEENPALCSGCIAVSAVVVAGERQQCDTSLHKGLNIHRPLCRELLMRRELVRIDVPSQNGAVEIPAVAVKEACDRQVPRAADLESSEVPSAHSCKGLVLCEVFRTGVPSVDQAAQVVAPTVVVMSHCNMRPGTAGNIGASGVKVRVCRAKLIAEASRLAGWQLE